MTQDDPTAPRRRGRPPLIDRARIVAAARSLAPQDLTMQAVADALGVDRKALNYHVSDREGLLELVASDVFADGMARVRLSGLEDWRDAVRLFARGMRDSTIATGILVPYFRFPAVGGIAALEPAEQVLQALLRAGFDARDAGRTLGLVGEFTFSSARDALLVRQAGTHPQDRGVLQVLDEAPPGRLPALRQYMTGRTRGLDDEQFVFDLDVLIAGLEARLAAGRGAGARNGRRRTG